MSFEKQTHRHLNHPVGIIMRYHRGRLHPVPGLYCLTCSKLIKWLTYDEANILLESGVEDLGMLPDELAIWQKNLQKQT